MEVQRTLSPGLSHLATRVSAGYQHPEGHQGRQDRQAEGSQRAHRGVHMDNHSHQGLTNFLALALSRVYPSTVLLWGVPADSIFCPLELPCCMHRLQSQTLIPAQPRVAHSSQNRVHPFGCRQVCVSPRE